MQEKIRILVLSTWSSNTIVADEEAKEILERLQEGPHRNRFQVHTHTPLRSSDLQTLLLMYEPHIVHFSGRGGQLRRVLFGTHGRGNVPGYQGLPNVLALYNTHVRLVLLDSCFTKAQARSVSEVINYSIGLGKAIDDKIAVAFAGAFYRALVFGKSVRGAFESAKAELTLTAAPRSRGIELFVRPGVSEKDRFPRIVRPPRRRNQLRRRYHRRSGGIVPAGLRHVAR